MTPANAYKVIDAGANALVAGSAVFGAPDYAEGTRGSDPQSDDQMMFTFPPCTAIRGIKASKAPVNAAVPA